MSTAFNAASSGENDVNQTPTNAFIAGLLSLPDDVAVADRSEEEWEQSYLDVSPTWMFAEVPYPGDVSAALKAFAGASDRPLGVYDLTAPNKPIGEHGTIIGGMIDPAIWNRPIVIAWGIHAKDMQWENVPGTVGQLVESLCTYQVGPKDGACITQGELVGPRRIWQNVSKNHIVMLDIDTGMTLDEIVERLRQKGLFGVIWATHSHMKTVTDIGEQAFNEWAKKNKASAVPSDATVIAYLKNEKKYRDNVLATCVYRGRELQDGGVKFIVDHEPMPKYRVLFVRKHTFDFAAGVSQKSQTDIWKKESRGLAQWLDIPSDVSCIDPCRLMFTPRAKKGSEFGPGKFEVLVINGRILDVAEIVSETTGDDPFSRRAKSEGQRGRNDKSSLPPEGKKFAAECPDFDVMACMEQHGGERRDSHGQMDKASYSCPFEGRHTPVAGVDEGFWITGDAATHWGAYCSHSTCKAACKDTTGEENDRLYYLDASRKLAGLEWADLYEFSEIGRKKLDDDAAAKQEAQSAHEKRWGAAEASAGDADTFAQTLKDFMDASKIGKATDAQLAVIMDALATMPASSVVKISSTLAALKTATGAPIKSLRDKLAQLHKEYVASLKSIEDAENPQRERAGGRDDVDRELPEDLSQVDAIYDHWDFNVKCEAVKAKIVAGNTQEPRLFKTSQGSVRLESNDGQMKVVSLNHNKWLAEITDIVPIKRVDAKGNVKGIAPPQDVLSFIDGSSDLGLPELRGFSRIGVFGPDGTLHENKGYDPDLKLYIDPNYVPLPVPAVPTKADVDDARHLLCEAIRDFPFTDVFGDVDPEPIRIPGDVDVDGHPKPNMNRGQSSRANALAMIILPFAREMIDGPTPLHFINKPGPGSGAGYLMDVATFISEGGKVIPQTMSSDREKFADEMQAAVKSKLSTIFIDNIVDNFNNPTFASISTANKVTFRPKSSPDMVTVEVRARLAATGNNASLQQDIARRTVPIGINSEVPNPARDRPPEFFKHHPLGEWLKANRANLIQACQILVRNWIVNGRPAGNANLQSFDAWSPIMGGILASAGIPGFLANLVAFHTGESEEVDGNTHAMQRLLDKHKLEPFTALDAFYALTSTFGHSTPGEVVLLPFKPRDGEDNFNAQETGKWLAKLRTTYDLDLAGQPVRVQFVKDPRTKRGITYRFVNKL